MDQWAKHFSSLPMGASARDQSTSMDELGRKVYRSPTGQQYTFPMAGEGGQRGSVVRAAAEDPKGALSSIISALVGGVGSAIAAPGRAAMGQPVTNGDVWSTGGMAQLAAMPMQAPEGALRSGTMGSTRAADDVLGMLKSGRAAEVTDDMMAAADPHYLYQNYDLPMDAASRMGRARGMGFDTGTPLYRGDARPNLQQFDVGQLARENIGVTSSRSPNVAATYMTGDNGAMYPLFSRAQNPLNIDANGRNWTGIPADARANSGTLDSILEPHDYLDEDNLFDFQNSSPIDWGDGTSTDMAMANTNDVSRAAQASGFDEVRFNNIVDRGGAGQYHTGPANDPQTTVMTADPRNIRSQFARFDPRLSHLKNLSAAAAPVAMGSLAAMPRSDKEEIRKYLGMIY